jgi:hypothetical protein
MRHIWLVGILVLACPSASAMDLWTFNGRCTVGVVKQAPPSVDMSNMRGSPISCDASWNWIMDDNLSNSPRSAAN